MTVLREEGWMTGKGGTSARPGVQGSGLGADGGRPDPRDQQPARVRAHRRGAARRLDRRRLRGLELLVSPCRRAQTVTWRRPQPSGVSRAPAHPARANPSAAPAASASPAPAKRGLAPVSRLTIAACCQRSCRQVEAAAKRSQAGSVRSSRSARSGRGGRPHAGGGRGRRGSSSPGAGARRPRRGQPEARGPAGGRDEN